MYNTGIEATFLRGKLQLEGDIFTGREKYS